MQWKREIRQKETVVTRPYLKKPIILPPDPPEKLEELLNKDRENFRRGYHIDGYTSGGQYMGNEWIPPGQYIETTRELYLPSCDVPLGVFSESEITRIREVCARELLEHNSLELFQRMDETVEFCQLLSQPDNHILVASGQYIEKPVSIASTQEMTNQAIQALTDLPRFQAYAKTIQEQDGRQEVWKGRIATNAPPARINNLDIEDQITQITHEKCCKPRSEIAKEIASRRLQWRSTGGGDDAPPSRIM